MATVAHLDFERAIGEVEEQIDRLQDLARERGLDVSAELRSLERKLHTLKRDVYRNLAPIERVMVARHPNRPYSLDYLKLVFSDFIELRDQKVEIACVVTDAARQVSKRDGAEWGRITIEDFHGTATVLAFGDAWAACKDLLSKDTPVLIRGGVSGRERDEEDPPIFLDGVTALSSIRETGEVGLCINLQPDRATVDELQRVKIALSGSPGSAPVMVLWKGNRAVSPVQEGHPESRLRSRTLKVAPREELLKELREVLGEEGVTLVRA